MYRLPAFKRMGPSCFEAVRRMSHGTLCFIIVCVIFLSACAMDQAKIREQTNTHLNLGTAYIEAGDYNGALRELMKAEKLSPDDPRIHYSLGLSYYAKGYRDKAADEFKRAIALKPDYSDAHNDLGTIYLDMGQWDRAAESFNQALTNILYDKPSNTLYNLGRSYYGKGDYKKALIIFGDAISKYPRADLVPLIEHYLGRSYYALKDFPGAVTHFKKSVELAPSYVESYYWLGECYRERGRLKDAKKAFETVIKLAPDSEFSHKSRESLSRLKI